MKPKHFAILGLYLVCMILAFDVAPIIAQAQGTQGYLCINRDLKSGFIAKADASNKCLSQFTGSFKDPVLISYQDFCVYPASTSWKPISKTSSGAKITTNDCNKLKGTMYQLSTLSSSTVTQLPAAGGSTPNSTPVQNQYSDPSKRFCLSMTGDPVVVNDPKCDSAYSKYPLNTSDLLYKNKFYGYCLTAVSSQGSVPNFTVTSPINIDTSNQPICNPGSTAVNRETLLKSLTPISPIQNPTGSKSGANQPSSSTLGCDPTKNNVGCINSPVGTTGTIPALILRLLNYILGGIVISTVLAVMIGGVRLILSSGNPEQRKKAKDMILWAFVGLIVTLMSYSIVAIVQKLV